MIAGQQVNIGGTEYTVPPLNLRLFFEHKDNINVLTHPGAHDIVEYTNAAIAVLHDCLKRNYPDVSRDSLLDGVEYPDLPRLVGVIFGQSGFTSRPLEATPTPSP